MREGLILGSHGHCAALSANIVAGNAPVNPTLIQQQLLLLLEDGETVEPIPCTNHAVLWRESLLDSKIGVSTSMGRDSRITIVDLAPSLLGLASLFLPDKVRDTVRVRVSPSCLAGTRAKPRPGISTW